MQPSWSASGASGPVDAVSMSWPIVTLPIQTESDVVVVRQRARRMAELLGFDRQDQTRIATAVSEIARNAFSYAGGGRAEFAIDPSRTPQCFRIRISDKGDGIADLDSILDGRYRSQSGMGLGLVGARRLMDHFTIDTGLGKGTTVELEQKLPRRAAKIAQGSCRRSSRICGGSMPTTRSRRCASRTGS